MRRLELTLGLLACLAAALMPNSSSAEALITVQPESTRIYINDEFILYITINPEIDSLMGYDVTLSYDPWYLEARDAQEGSLPLTSGHQTFFMWLNEDTPGDSICVNGSILGNTVDGPGVLFRVTFLARNPGVTTVEISRSDLRNDENQKLPHGRRHGTVLLFPTVSVDPPKWTWGRLKCLFR